jgi:bacterioferritin
MAMKTFPGDPKVIAVLHDALIYEAHMNLQYRLDQRLLKFMGAKKVASKFHAFGDDAHSWMGMLTKQILFLGGDAAYQIPPITSPSTLTDLLQDALALEMATVQPFEQAIEICRLAFSDAERNIFEHLRKWENRHIGWLMTQLNLIGGIGESEYLAEKL